MGVHLMHYNSVLITGGAGFIGSYVAKILSKDGINVRVLDCFSNQIHGVDYKTSFLYNQVSQHAHILNGSVNSREEIIAALDGTEAVIHLAAETGTGQSMYEIEKYTHINIDGTALLLDVIANTKNTVKKVVLASSRAIYGEGKYKCRFHGNVYPLARKKEDMINGDYECKCPVCGQTVELMATDESSSIHPTSTYGLTKQVQEELCHLIGKAIGIPTVALRYQNVYGTGQSLKNPYTGILSIFSTCILNNNEINIFEDGKESRDFIYVEDVARATKMALESPDVNFQNINVGTGTNIDVLTVVEALAQAFNKKATYSITGDFRIGDIRHNYADISLLNNMLGFNPQYTFDTGICRFAEWVMKQEICFGNNYQASLSEMKSKGLMING